MSSRLWLAVIRGVGGVLMSAAAIYAAWESTRRDNRTRKY